MGGRFLFAGFLVVGIIQLVWCIVDSRLALLSARWPTVAGTVISAQVVEDTSGRGTASFPRVRYSYVVNGTTYIGRRIYFRDASELPEQAQTTVRSFPLNSHVAVYYRPENPDDSLLKPGLYWYSFAWLGLALMAVAIGGTGLFLLKKRKAVLGVA